MSEDSDPQEAAAAVLDKNEEELQDFVLKDRFGFFLSDDFHSHTELPEKVVSVRKEKECMRAGKWVKMLKKWEAYYQSGKGQKMRSRVRKGIPDVVRGYAWYHFAQSGDIQHRFPNAFAIDTAVVPRVTIDEIDRDIDRTFPRHVMFVEENGLGQTALRHLLQWYAALDPEVGYCQGMGFIAALFLTYMIEEQAFYTFYTVLNRPQSPLRLMYLPKLSETQKVLHIFGDLANHYLPKLWEHFTQEGIHQTMFVTEWVMTIFCRGFSFELVTRVWDIFMYEGDMKIIYRVALAILKYFEKEFLSMKFDKIMALLREVARRIDVVLVFEIAWSIPLRREQIKFFENQYLEELRATEERKSAKALVANGDV